MACEHLPSPFGSGTSADVPPFGEDGARVLMSTPPRPSAGVEVPLGAYPARRLVEVTAHVCAGLCDGGALCSAPYLAPRSAVVCALFLPSAWCFGPADVAFSPENLQPGRRPWLVA